ncbi:MAG: hypothetical protein IPO47_07515 [Bacteroidetes bacterium]|nr:hypothetical protein [Bacteroidota bacterium]
MKIKELNVDYPLIDEEIKTCKDKIQATNNSLIEEKETVPQKKVMISFETNNGKIEIEQNNSFSAPEPGKKAFKNGQQAPTGKYKFGFMWYVHIENGIVTKVTLL